MTPMTEEDIKVMKEMRKRTNATLSRIRTLLTEIEKISRLDEGPGLAYAFTFSQLALITIVEGDLCPEAIKKKMAEMCDEHFTEH